MLTDGRTHGRTDDGRKVITIAHPEQSSGKLKTTTKKTKKQQHKNKQKKKKKKKKKTFKRHLLPDQWPDFKMISQKCFSHAPLPNCLNGSAPLNKMAGRAKNRKPFKRHLLPGQWPDFKIISQECSSHALLPKLLKWFRSAKQNGR